MWNRCSIRSEFLKKIGTHCVFCGEIWMQLDCQMSTKWQCMLLVQWTYLVVPIIQFMRNFYMDALLSSKPNSDGAANLAKQLINLLTTGLQAHKVLAGIPTLKWHVTLLILIVLSCHKEEPLVSSGTQNKISCLQLVKSGFPNTKRGILSATSSGFDALARLQINSAH